MQSGGSCVPTHFGGVLCSNSPVRVHCGALVFMLLAVMTGHGQGPDVPTGDARISGRILTSTSQPIAGATVLLGLNDTDAAWESTAWWNATSDQNGRYQFADLPAGRFILVASRSGYVGWESIPAAAPAPMVVARRVPALALSGPAARSSINLVPGGRASEVNVTLHQPASISGRMVLPDGSPAVKTLVMLYTVDAAGAITSGRGSAPTDTNGGYSFSDIRPGTYFLGLLQPTRRVQDVDRSALTPVTVTEGASLRNVQVHIPHDLSFFIAGRVVDSLGQVPRAVRVEYGVPGATHRGTLSVSSPDGRFRVRDPGIVPGPLAIVARGESDDGPMIGLLTLTTTDGPNEVELVVGKPGGLRGRVSMEVPVSDNPRLALVREGFTPLDTSDEAIGIAPGGWVEAGNLIGEYRVRVDEPPAWTVKAIRRRGTRLKNDRLVVPNAEIIDEIEIVIGPVAAK